MKNSIITKIKVKHMIILLIPLFLFGCQSKSSQEEQMCANEVCSDKAIERDAYNSQLDSLEAKLLRSIFDSVLKSGSAPIVTELEDALKISHQKIIHTLNSLEAKDLLHRNKGTQAIDIIYPFSLKPTKHQIFLEEGKRLYAMCAVDAVGISAMFNRDIKVISQCEQCGQRITIEIENSEIVSISHPEIMIWRTQDDKARPSFETCCPTINFFCSREHLEAWKAENSDLAKMGSSLILKQDFPGIKQKWEAYGRLIGILKD